jgi:hypothetical protein
MRIPKDHSSSHVGRPLTAHTEKTGLNPKALKEISRIAISHLPTFKHSGRAKQMTGKVLPPRTRAEAFVQKKIKSH